MSYNFSEHGNFAEKMLLKLKKEYLEPKMTDEQLKMLKKRLEEEKMKGKTRRNIQITAAAAALAGAFVVLPNTNATIAHAMEQLPIIGRLAEALTFRNYDYENERNAAHLEIPEIDTSKIGGKLSGTAEEINAEIKEITDGIISRFEEEIKNEQGYQDVAVKGEILSTTEDYFTLKLICYQGAGSGYEWNYYYTVDLKTGERLKLGDIFADGSDYVTPISENIKEQMRQRMAEDDGTIFWLDEEIEDWNFKSISEDNSFYLNKRNNVVICFDEGEVAPMYMGTVEFEIPSEIIDAIRK